MEKHKSLFIISLDFELYWGVRDSRSLDDYRENLLGVRALVPALLDLFQKYQIHATWATVEFLFFETRDELLAALPATRPAYSNTHLDPYRYVRQIGRNEQEDPYHFAPSLIREISATPHQEIGSHTFSHYYCLEEGQDSNSFRADLEAALRVARTRKITMKSLVFPKNQCSQDHLAVCQELGILCYRGTQSSWLYQPRPESEETLVRRALRLADAYASFSSGNSKPVREIAGRIPFNVSASRFLRPYSPRLNILEPLRHKRILSEMTHAAKNNLSYHLWWHPHNFGSNTLENLSFLRVILDHYAELREQHGMESQNMGELSRVIATQGRRVH